MLTPAEELGLSGLNLAGRVRQALIKLPEPAVLDLVRRMREEAFRRHLIYLRDGGWDWLVFTSANGVHALLSRFDALGRDLRDLGRVKLAAIGPVGWSFWRPREQAGTWYTAAYQDGDRSVVLFSSSDGKRSAWTR